jgi:hypothetical protein
MMAGSPLNGRDLPAWGYLPSGRMSLLDMMNFALHSFVGLWELMRQELGLAVRRSTETENAIVADPDRQRLLTLLESCMRIFCQQMMLQRTESRIRRMYAEFGVPSIKVPEVFLVTELQALLQAIEDDIETERFYHYPPHKGFLFLRIPGDWAETLTAFPSVKEEIEEGVDCYATEHNTACVFHMMRVAEIGMRALARERKVSFPKHPLEWADWQNIIEGIEKSVRALGPVMPRGPAKDAALAFYSGAVGQLNGFKDTYRNVVMHVRRSYDELDALRAINQVRDFMNGLSAKIDEKTHRPIRRWS